MRQRRAHSRRHAACDRRLPRRSRDLRSAGCQACEAAETNGWACSSAVVDELQGSRQLQGTEAGDHRLELILVATGYAQCIALDSRLDPRRESANSFDEIARQVIPNPLS